MKPRIEARRFAVHASLLYAATFLVIGTFLPFFPVWLDWRGLSAQEISVVVATPLFVRVLFTPTISFVADRSGAHVTVLRGLAWGVLVTALAFYGVSDFWTILIVGSAFAMFWTTVMPLSETIVMERVRATGLDYGRMRLWGSLSFIAASIGGGRLLEAHGPFAVLWMLTGAAVLVVLVVEAFAFSQRGAAREPAEGEAGSLDPREAFRLLKAPLFLLFLAAASALQTGHAVYYAFGTLHWQAAGHSTAVIGVLWTIGVVAEVVLFAISGRALALLGPAGLLALGGAGAVVRWSLTALDPPLVALVALQCLHGLTFGAAHLGAIHFISRATPAGVAATAQGVYATAVMGLGMGTVMMLAGPLYAEFGGAAYHVMAVLGAFGLLAAAILAVRWDGGQLDDPPRGGARRRTRA